MVTNADFAAEAEQRRMEAFVAKNAPKACRRCKAGPGAVLTPRGLCYKCESTRLKSMQDDRFVEAAREPIPANESPQETNARLARAHADLRARENTFNHPQTDAEKLVGANGPKATGAEFFHLQTAENLRLALATALKSLPGAADRSILSQNARSHYENLHATCLKLANDYCSFTGRQVLVPGLRPDAMRGTDIVVGAAPAAAAKTLDPFEIDEPAKPSKAKIGKFAPGYGRT